MVTPAQDLARRVDEVTGQASPGRSLRRGSLRFLRTAALPVGIQGPTAGVIIGPATPCSRSCLPPASAHRAPSGWWKVSGSPLASFRHPF
jgi:hypothetical protein